MKRKRTLYVVVEEDGQPHDEDYGILAWFDRIAAEEWMSTQDKRRLMPVDIEYEPMPDLRKKKPTKRDTTGPGGGSK